MFIQEFYSNIHGVDTDVPQFVTTFRGTRIVVTSDLISEVLRVPRVAYPHYPGCEHLRTVSRDDFPSHFYEKPSLWGSALNNPCSGFAKGPHSFNMVMTFNLTPLSYYNSITKPRARFLLSLMEGRSIEFPSHFITSILDMYLDTATYISSSFLWLSHGSFRTSPFLFLSLLFSLSWVPLALVLSSRVRLNFN